MHIHNLIFIQILGTHQMSIAPKVKVIRQTIKNVFHKEKKTSLSHLKANQ